MTRVGKASAGERVGVLVGLGLWVVLRQGCGVWFCTVGVYIYIYLGRSG